MEFNSEKCFRKDVTAMGQRTEFTCYIHEWQVNLIPLQKLRNYANFEDLELLSDFHFVIVE